MKILSAITNILLSVLIVLSGSAFVAQSVTQTSSIQNAAEESGVYKGISEVVGKQLNDLAAEEAIKAGVPSDKDLSSLVDEAYVTTKGEDLIRQIEDYRSGKSNSIVLDISDIAAQAKAQGVNIDEATLKPIEIVPPSTVKQPGNVASTANYSQIILYVVTALFFVASIIIAVLRRRMLGLFLALLVSAITLLLIALSSSLIGSFAYSYLSLPAEVSQLNPYVRSFARALFSDAGRLFLIEGLVLLALSVVALIADRLIRKKVVDEPTENENPPKPEVVEAGAKPAETAKSAK
jgi:hypothetical protein